MRNGEKNGIEAPTQKRQMMKSFNILFFAAFGIARNDATDEE